MRRRRKNQNRKYINIYIRISSAYRKCYLDCVCVWVIRFNFQGHQLTGHRLYDMHFKTIAIYRMPQIIFL